MNIRSAGLNYTRICNTTALVFQIFISKSFSLRVLVILLQIALAKAAGRKFQLLVGHQYLISQVFKNISEPG